MTYFTSWDINVFLCLLDMGLPWDVTRDWTKKLKRVHRNFVFEEAKDYYLDRKGGLPTTGSKKDRKLLRDRQSDWAYGYGKEINMKTLRPIKTIPNNFWLLIQKLNWEYERKLEDIEPEDKYEYFEWAYVNHYYFWNYEMLVWVKGFHPGRFYLMDHRRKVIAEEIRDLEGIGARLEGEFIRKQDHIDDLLEGRKNIGRECPACYN